MVKRSLLSGEGGCIGGRAAQLALLDDGRQLRMDPLCRNSREERAEIDGRRRKGDGKRGLRSQQPGQIGFEAVLGRRVFGDGSAERDDPLAQFGDKGGFLAEGRPEDAIREDGLYGGVIAEGARQLISGEVKVQPKMGIEAAIALWRMTGDAGADGMVDVMREMVQKGHIGADTPLGKAFAERQSKLNAKSNPEPVADADMTNAEIQSG